MTIIADTQLQTARRPETRRADTSADSPALAELRRAVEAALETYSNVHRGSGHNSLVSTHLYEQAREIVLEYLGLSASEYTVVFCSPRRAEALKRRLPRGSYPCVSSEDLGLALGLRALAVRRAALPGGAPSQAGGGTARLVAPGWVVWAQAPDKFEAGTPAIVNVIALAKALRLSRQYGPECFRGLAPAQTAAGILYRDALEAYSGRELLGQLRQTHIGRGVRVPTLEGAQPFINLDNAASTPTFTPIWEAAWQAWRLPPAAQRDLIREVRSLCAQALDAPPDRYEVIFTANTTEAINLAAESLRREAEPGVQPVVVNTFMEHNSNELPWRRLRGLSLVRLPVDPEGFVDLNALEALLRDYNEQAAHGQKRIRLLAVSGASNVLGAFNDLATISALAHRYGARLLVDGAQLAAHRQVELDAWEIDYLAFSAHKAYAPFGSGALVVRQGLLRFSPAERELIRSSGEENAGGLAALGKALALLRRIGLDVIQAEEQALTARALGGLRQIPGVTVYGVQDPASPRFARKGGVIVFKVEGALAHGVARALAERGAIGVRSGCHCAHLLIKRLLNVPPLLELFQGLLVTLFPRLSLPGLSRVSLGVENTLEDVDTLLRVLAEVARRPPAMENPFASSRPKTEIEQRMDDFARAAARRVYADC